MERDIECEIESLTSLGKMWMTKEIRIHFSDDEISISRLDSRPGTEIRYKYQKLEYDDDRQKNLIVGDGLKILFDLSDCRAWTCLNQLKQLIQQKTGNKEKRRQSGPRNTLTNLDTPRKTYKVGTLDLVTKPPHHHPTADSIPILARPSMNLSPPPQEHRVTSSLRTQPNYPPSSLDKLPTSRRSQEPPKEPVIVLPAAVNLEV